MVDLFFTLLPWILSGLTFLVMWMAGNKDIRGWYIGLGAQVLWVIFDIYVEAWGLLPIGVGLTYIYIRNILKWRKAEVPSTPTLVSRHADHSSLFAYSHYLSVSNPERYPVNTLLQHSSGEIVRVTGHLLELERDVTGDKGRPYWKATDDIIVVGATA